MIKQYRWFGIDNPYNSEGATMESFKDGTFFNDVIGKQIKALGIQAPPGTKVYVSSAPMSEDMDIENVKEYILINSTGLFQTNFALSNINFVLGGFNVLINEEAPSVMVDHDNNPETERIAVSMLPTIIDFVYTDTQEEVEDNE